MEKEFAVIVDVTLSCTMYVKASSEDEARERAESKINHDPYEIARQADTYVDSFIVDAYEVDD